MHPEVILRVLLFGGTLLLCSEPFSLFARLFTPSRTFRTLKRALLKIKRKLSQRTLQANRANALRSTGPKSNNGKSVSRMNALKHGIFSRTAMKSTSASYESADATPSVESVLKEELRGELRLVRNRLERLVAFEQNCAKDPDLLERNARLIGRYDRMLTRQLHKHVRECANLETGN
jgi:hypothetical protein